MEKTAAVEALGQESLLLPAWIKAALAANDRLKFYLSLMQSVAQQATHPQPGQVDWKAEIGRLGLQEQAWLAGFGRGAYRADDVLFVPRVDEWLAALSRDLHVMARPACERGSHPDAALTARRDAWLARLEQLQDEEGLSDDALAEITHGDHHRSDSLHLLVMDLHKAINAMAAEVATEDIMGAHVWQIAPGDREWVEAFQRGIHATAPLKFGHPGLDTAVTRDGDRLLIQNDIGTNDAHVLVLQWSPGELSLTYSDLHVARFEFFGRMLQSLGFDWEAMPVQTHGSLNAGKPYQVGHAWLRSRHESRLREALEMAASRIVFVIDWNRARKRLQPFVRKPVAVEILEQLARENMGHMAWLLAGADRLVFEAMQAVNGDAFRVGDRLDQVLGEAAARDYLLALMRSASLTLREQHPTALVADEARMLLPRAMRKRTFEFDLLAEHAAFCHALAEELTQGLLADADPAAGQRRVQRAKTWERQADHLLTEARQRAERQARWMPMLDLLDRMDDVADVVEEAIFLLNLTEQPAMATMPQVVRESLSRLAEATLAAVQDQIRAIEMARHLHDNVAQVEGEEFLQALWRILRAERVCDDLHRAARTEIVRNLSAQAAAMQLTTELASTIESATDHLLGAAYSLRKIVFEKSGVQA